VTRKNHTLRGILQVFGVLTVLLGAAALAQVRGTGQPSAKLPAVSVRPDVSSVGHASGNHVERNTLGTSPTIASVPLFLPGVPYNSGGAGAFSVAAADVNGDGVPDLVVANLCESSSNCAVGPGGVAVLMGNGDGTFQTPVAYSSGGRLAVSVAVADVNGDGKLDLLVANNCASGNSCPTDGAVGVLLGIGDGTFQTAAAYGSGGAIATSVAVADVNGDGKLDLVVGNACGSINCPSPSKVGVLLGNGDGTFQAAVSYDPGGSGAASVKMADVNGDGKPDLLVANPNSRSLGVLLGNGDGTFQAAVSYDPGGLANSVAVADVNGDGKLDLVVANVCASNSNCPPSNGVAGVLLGNGDGTFQVAVGYDSGGIFANSIAVADVNGDGKPDLLLANFVSNTIGVLLGNGDGTFEQAVTYNSPGDMTESVTVADLNGDGNPDILVASDLGPSGDGGSVSALLHTELDTTPPVITLAATPKVLWPPNGKLVPVTISGRITDAASGVNASSAKFAVHDEYHLVQPHGTIALDPAGNYSFTILLQASRKGDDHDGRRYTIRVTAIDNAGNRGVKQTSVTVLHRRQHRRDD